MRLILIFISLFFYLSKIYAGQFSMTAYVYYNTDKIFPYLKVFKFGFGIIKVFLLPVLGLMLKANAEAQIE